MKKLFAVLLVLVMVFSLFAVTASADFGDNIVYEEEYNDELGLADKIGNDDTVLGYLDEGYEDVDCFEFKLTAECELVLVGGAEHDGVIMAIYDSTGENCVAAVYPEYIDGVYVTTIATILPAGKYYVGVFAIGDYVGEYSEYMFYLYYSKHNHSYDNSCDGDCNVCFEKRNTHHFFDDENDFICNNCNNSRTPCAPIVVSVNSNSVMLERFDGVEYSLDGINWQKSNIFFDLEELSEYTVYQRVALTGQVPESEISEATVFTTLERPLYVSCDVNGDGVINTRDLALIKLYACGMAIAESGADCDKDGNIDTSDLAAVKLRLAGI